MDREPRSDGYTAIEDRFAGYEVYDRSNEKIGKVDDLFVNEADQPEYIGVKMGFLGTRSTIIPWELVSSTDDEENTITVSTDKDRAKNSPTFDDDGEITSQLEEEVYSYYGLERAQTAGDRGTYGDYYGETSVGAGSGTAGPGMTMGDREGGEFHEHSPAAEGVAGEGHEDLEDEDELRVQRSEEELAAGTREREAGALRVRKRVRTDREQIEVPTRHEEVSVERVPVSEHEATEAEIGEDEVSVPVTEEEVVVEKRPVVKEEVRVRKDVVSDTETVEEEVRKEEVEVEDETERRGA